MTFNDDIIEKIRQIVDISKVNGVDIKIECEGVTIAIKTPTVNMSYAVANEAQRFDKAKNEHPVVLDTPGFTEVKSKAVGVVYLQPAPNKSKFITVGCKVKKGDTLLIIESMKVMNNLLSPCDGVIRKIYCDNEQAVEYDEPLVQIEER